MYCRYCGAELPNDSIFCNLCGKQLNSEPAVGEHAQIQRQPQEDGYEYQFLEPQEVQKIQQATRIPLNNEKTMKWYYFLIYFYLLVSPLLKILIGVYGIIGAIGNPMYELMGLNSILVFNSFFYIVFAVYEIAIRHCVNAELKMR